MQSLLKEACASTDQIVTTLDPSISTCGTVQVLWHDELQPLILNSSYQTLGDSLMIRTMVLLSLRQVTSTISQISLQRSLRMHFTGNLRSKRFGCMLVSQPTIKAFRRYAGASQEIELILECRPGISGQRAIHASKDNVALYL